MEGPKRNTFTNFGFGVLERLTMADESSRNASNRTNNATDTNKIAVSGKSCIKLADPYMIGESQEPKLIDIDFVPVPISNLSSANPGAFGASNSSGASNKLKNNQTVCCATQGNSNSNGVCGDRNISSKMKDDTSDYNPQKLPKRAIIYDYTRQPIGIIERKREFLPNIMSMNIPFLRPIYIDGIGFIKAVVGPNDLREFPLTSLVRCLFYWISKGHKTLVCYPNDFNPFKQKNFFCTSQTDEAKLKKLYDYNMLQIFDAEDSLNWYNDKLRNIRACLVTNIAHWHQGMPSSLEYDSYIPTRQEKQAGPDRLLQPFFDNNLVFFSSYSSKGLCVADLVLDNNITSQEEFDQFDKNQLQFTEQAKMLKFLYDFLRGGSTNLLREEDVMIEILKRLQFFL